MEVIRRYGVVHKSGIMARGTYFLVDKRGIVRAWWPGKVNEVAPGDPMLRAARKVAGKL